MGSLSKGLMHKTQGRQQLRESFLRGVLVGLLMIFCWMCLRMMIWGMPVGQAQMDVSDGHKGRLLAFVGVQSGFSRPKVKLQYVYEARREVLRQTWFPSPRSELDKLERRTGIRVRFVIGHTKDAKAESDLEAEQNRHNDILRLNIWEEYLSLTYKTFSYLQYVSTNFDVQYIVKIDDDIYFRLDRLPAAIPQWIDKTADYIGCMKRGQVFTKPGVKWREPQHPILGHDYYTHVWGCAYVVSGRAATLLTSTAEGSLRFLNNEDTTLGLWMMAFNVTYLDDRRFCTIQCMASSLVVTDYPECAGLCNPQWRLVELHKDSKCHATPNEIPLQREIIQVNDVRSRQLPVKRMED